jgi:hypothetical protein
MREETFTASAIARALGCSKQNVHQHLSDISADGEKLIAGSLSKAWRTGSLPAQLVRQLSEKAEIKRCRTIADLLREPFDRYEPGVPLSEIAPAAINRALKLQTALAPILPLRKHDSIARAELARRGIAAYKNVYGHAISPKLWLALFDRTIERDNGAEEWTRLQIYVEDRPPRISTRLAISIARECKLEVFESALDGLLCKGVTRLSVEQKDYLWDKARDEIELQKQSGIAEKKTKRGILKAILASGFFGQRKETIRQNLNTQLERREAGHYRDRRTLRKKQLLADGDKHTIAGHALSRGGDLQAGWKAARNAGDLSEELDNRHASNVVAVPNRIRREVGPLVKSIYPLTKGERSFRADGPSHIGDYSQLFAGVIFEMDDWTPEHLCYEERENSRPVFLQGQLIALLDKATRRILEIAFTGGAYTAQMIRLTINNACKNYCLCDALHLESGLWKKARVIVGRKVVDHSEWEMGVKEFMEVVNFKRPQSKGNIEKWFDQIGRLMRPVPGWCGKDMRHTMPEPLKRQIACAERGEIHPSEFCLQKDEMFTALLNACEAYNNEPQHNGRLKGRTPNEAWADLQDPAGRPSLGSKAAYLLAYHREKYEVRKSQIEMRHSGIRHVYHSPEVSRFDRQSVLVWWNPDDLSQIAISSLDRKDGPFLVPVQEKTLVSARPDYAQIRRNQANIDETLDVRRAQFRSVQPWLAKARLRPTLVDAPTARFGKQLDTGWSVGKRKQNTRARNVQRAQRFVRDGIVNVPVSGDNAEDVNAAAELVRQVYSEEPKQ